MIISETGEPITMSSPLTPELSALECLKIQQGIHSQGKSQGKKIIFQGQGILVLVREFFNKA